MAVTIYCGDALRVLRTLPSGLAHTVVTSPPYFGLRDYQTATWEGGREHCDHLLDQGRRDTSDPPRIAPRSDSDVEASGYRGTCSRCGASRVDFQLGLEQTPEEYVTRLVRVFREVRRVLRDDGTLWLVLGDSYVTDGRKGRASFRAGKNAAYNVWRNKCAPGYKDKELFGIPWRVAFALQQDGWYLRADVVWSKPNPTPESVADRPSRSHEFIFLLTKVPRGYYYDATAIAEPARYGTSTQAQATPDSPDAESGDANGAATTDFTTYQHVGATRNRRSVWSIPTRPFRAAHFAVFPTALAELCVLAGSAPSACESCGAPWRRQTQRSTAMRGGSGRAGRAPEDVNRSGKWAGRQRGANLKLGPVVTTTTIGWRPSCSCELNTGRARCVALDPFAGAGTVGLVAARLGRDAVLIDLNPSYIEMARDRIANDAPLLERGHVSIQTP